MNNNHRLYDDDNDQGRRPKKSKKKKSNKGSDAYRSSLLYQENHDNNNTTTEEALLLDIYTSTTNLQISENNSREPATTSTTTLSRIPETTEGVDNATRQETSFEGGTKEVRIASSSSSSDLLLMNNQDDEMGGRRRPAKKQKSKRNKKNRPIMIVGANDFAEEIMEDDPSERVNRSLSTDNSNNKSNPYERETRRQERLGTTSATNDSSAVPQDAAPLQTAITANNTNSSSQRKAKNRNVEAAAKQLALEDTVMVGGSSPLYDPLVTTVNTEDPLGFPGAERVQGSGIVVGRRTTTTASLDDTDGGGTVQIGSNIGNGAPIIAHTSVDILARAQLVDDVIVAAAVGTNNDGELDQVRQQLNQSEKTKRQMRIGFVIVFVLVMVVITVLAVMLGRGNGSTPNPTTEPTQSPTTPPPSSIPTTAPTSIQENWIRLIQSRMPSTNFDDSTSPQRKALDWMLSDTYTISLNDDRIVQRFALAVLYFATNGPNTWTLSGGAEWLLPSLECDWGHRDDVACNDDEIVNWVNLYNDGISGSIPKEIALLSSLNWLDLRVNSLGATIPSEIGMLTSLTWLRLDENLLEGTIPSEVGLISALTGLNLAGNIGLSGTVPGELAKLSNLKELYFFSTTVSGSVPSSLCGASLETAIVECDLVICDCCTGSSSTPC